MSKLTFKTVAETYKDLLHVANNNQGVEENNLQYLYDGSGTQTPIALTTNTVTLSGNVELESNGTYKLGTANKRLGEIHSNKIVLNGVELTADPGESLLKVSGMTIDNNTSGQFSGGGDIGPEALCEISTGSWTLHDGEYVGQTKVITTLGTGTESEDTVIDVTTFACGTEITFKPVPNVRQSISLIYGSAGWVVTGRSHHYESDDKGPIVT